MMSSWSTPAPSPPQEPASSRMTKRGMRTPILLASIILFGVACVFVPRWYINTRIEPTAPLPGAATRFDVVQSLPEVASFVGEGAQLESFMAQFVRPDGTLDLEADYTPGPAVTYEFTKPASASDRTPPTGTDGGQTMLALKQPVKVTLTRPGQRFFVNKRNGSFTTAYSYISKGMQKSEEQPRMMPSARKNTLPICSFQELWRQAIEAGAPSDGVASILYNGTLYTLKVFGHPNGVAFGLDCKMIR